MPISAKYFGQNFNGIFYLQTSEWPGLYILNPFNFAEAVVIVTVQGVTALDLSEGHRFPFITDSPLSDIWTSVESKILDHYPYGQNQTLIEINLEHEVKSVSIITN